MKKNITLEFPGDNCLHCPFCYYSMTWDEYWCRIGNHRENGTYDDKLIQGHVEHTWELGPTPDWCPCTDVD